MIFISPKIHIYNFFLDKSFIIFGFECDDFDLIYNLSGKELFENLYKGINNMQI